jgi:hypothetical protein
MLSMTKVSRIEIESRQKNEERDERRQKFRQGIGNKIHCHHPTANSHRDALKDQGKNNKKL